MKEKPKEPLVVREAEAMARDLLKHPEKSAREQRISEAHAIIDAKMKRRFVPRAFRLPVAKGEYLKEIVRERILAGEPRKPREIIKAVIDDYPNQWQNSQAGKREVAAFRAELKKQGLAPTLVVEGLEWLRKEENIRRFEGDEHFEEIRRNYGDSDVVPHAAFLLRHGKAPTHLDALEKAEAARKKEINKVLREQNSDTGADD